MMPKPQRSSLIVWGCAVFIYVVAMAGRTSFGVAGLDAIDRFEIGAGVLSLFTVIQIGVYAGSQIPVGLALDRIGSRIVLSGGAVILALGQFLLAYADTLGLALTARVLIGFGDATAYTAILRLIPAWFRPFRVPIMTQLTGLTGQLGQVISSLPFAFVLYNAGWSPAFAGLGALGLFAAALGGFFIRNTVKDWPFSPISPGHAEAVKDPEESDSSPSVASTLREPGVWVGFWTHWTGNFPGTVFTLLWGVPFLQIHNGYSLGKASATLIVMSISLITVGPIIGEFVARFPHRRIVLIQATNVLVLGVWTTILLLPAPSPDWLIILLLIALGIASSASAIGFDFVRTSIDRRRLGIGNGLANMGGFIAGLISAGLIGILLDYASGGATLEPGDFKIAMAVQVLPWIVGVAALDFQRRRLQRRG